MSYYKSQSLFLWLFFLSVSLSLSFNFTHKSMNYVDKIQLRRCPLFFRVFRFRPGAFFACLFVTVKLFSTNSFVQHVYSLLFLFVYFATNRGLLSSAASAFLFVHTLYMWKMFHLLRKTFIYSYIYIYMCIPNENKSLQKPRLKDTTKTFEIILLQYTE